MRGGSSSIPLQKPAVKQLVWTKGRASLEEEAHAVTVAYNWYLAQSSRFAQQLFL